MILGNKLRCWWRRIKEPVLAGRGNFFQRAAYRTLAAFISRNKGKIASHDLEGLALWLMYHPEAGVLPCDGWKMDNPPTVSAEELAGLRAHRAADSAAVARRIGLEHLRLADSPRASAAGFSVAVHVHVFYPEMFPQILDALANIPVPYDLYVSVPHGLEDKVGSALETSAAGLRKGVKVLPCPNRGRDIAPMLCLFGKCLAGYDYVAHFHTKKSLHVIDRRGWLDHILARLLGGPELVSAIFELLGHGYGMVAHDDYLPVPEDPTGWMHNLAYAEDLVVRSGLDVDLRRDYTPISFPQGSMFWARTDFLRRFFELSLTFDDFPAEPVGVDGTIAHALERMFFLWGAGSGLKVGVLGGDD